MPLSRAASADREGRRAGARRRLSPAGLLLFAVAACVAGWVFWEGQRLIRADAASLKARHLLQSWSSGAAVPASDEQLAGVQAALQKALAITPDDPSLQEQLGDLYMVRGGRDYDDEALRRRHYLDAEAQYRKALALRPTDPQTWASLAAAYQGLGDTGARLHRAWERALELGPNEGYVQSMLLETALATWPTASPTMKRWADALFEASPPPQREAINALAVRYGLYFTAGPADAASSAARSNR